MKRSDGRIITTHVGSLPRPNDLIELYRTDAPDNVLLPRLKSAVAEVVDRQLQCGIDVVNDGEYGKAMRASADIGAWWSYVYSRIGGFEILQRQLDKGRSGWTFGSKERKEFAEFYRDTGGVGGGGAGTGSSANNLFGLVCTGPVTYTGHDLIRRDIENLKAAASGKRVADVFMPAVSPATLQILPNEHYGSPEDYTWALAEAIREEYRAIVDAGFILQIDDPAIVDLWDWWFSLKNDMAGYLKWAEFQVTALNHALEGIPEDRVRFHMCWGSWHGPHITDVPLKDVVHLLLKIKAQAYSVEAGNVRHEHEWKVWKTTKLPEGKLLIPGVVSHATHVVEHPEVIADRLVNYANAVGRENVIAGTDCGLGGRLHHQLAWAKLAALKQGADLASSQLWT
ncbi:MAG TPA: cobalamin-independent methionine synthase II family protein [Xanthobacteraceae bacterium]|nr:cobalamin-independent methionine synthase II family protein [Xanthobacteraceae bacterium]